MPCKSASHSVSCCRPYGWPFWDCHDLLLESLLSGFQRTTQVQWSHKPWFLESLLSIGPQSQNVGSLSSCGLWGSYAHFTYIFLDCLLQVSGDRGLKPSLLVRGARDAGKETLPRALQVVCGKESGCQMRSSGSGNQGLQACHQVCQQLRGSLSSESAVALFKFAASVPYTSRHSSPSKHPAWLQPNLQHGTSQQPCRP